MGYGVAGSVLLKYKEDVLATSKIKGFPTFKTGSQSMSSAATEEARFVNPIGDKQDPYILEKDGIYYYCFASAENINGTDYPAIKVAAHGSISFGELSTQCRTVFNATQTSNSNVKKEYWAPEIHYFDAATVGSANAGWYIYFAADNGTNANHRMYVLKATDPENPFSDYKLVGKITDSTNKWAIDGTVLQHGGKLYFLWSGWPGDSNGVQNIYIAQMSNPWTISSSRVLLSTPEYSWEKHGDPDVNEGPQVLKAPDGTVHIVYSASGSWDQYYCYGVLTLTGSNPLNASHWYKATSAKFSSGNGMYGPGHGTFVKDSVGDYWMIYHANASLNVPSGSSWWIERSIYAKKFSFTTMTLNGVSVEYPSFGSPAAHNSTQYIDVRTTDYHASGDHLYSSVMKITSGTEISLAKKCCICGTVTTLHKVDVPTATAKASSNGGTTVTITPTVSGATGYIIYRSTSSDGTYSEIGTTKSTTYTDTTGKVGTTYYYKVKQYKANAYGSDATYGRLVSSASAATNGVAATPAPVPFSAYYDGEIVNLSWAENKDVEKYRVFRRVAGETAWDDVTRMTANNYFNDNTVSKNTTYEYAVQSWTLVNGAYQYSQLAPTMMTITTKAVAAPTVTAVNTANGIKLTATAVSGATGYKFYRSTDGKTFTQLGKSAETAYEDTTAKAGTTYYYNVRAYITDGDVTNYSSPSTAAAIVKLAPITPTVLYDGGAVQLTWDASKTAEKYRIFKRVAGTSDWGDALTLVTDTSYTDKNVTNGTSYEYAVQDWTLVEGAYCYSVLDVRSITIIKLSAPTLTAANTVSGVKLTTTAVSGADGYKFYRSTDGKNFTQIAKITETTFEDTTAKAGTTYYYNTRAYIAGSEATNYSPLSSNVGIVKLATITPTIIYDGSAVQLTWDASKTAEKYRIFKRVAGTSDWGDALTLVTDTSYTDKNVTNGTSYEYAVQDWTLLDGAYCYSTLKVCAFTVTQLGTPTITVKNTDSGILLTVAEVSGADGYKFYRSTDGKNFTQIAKTTEKTFEDTTAKVGTTYYYNARAYTASGGANYSPLSANAGAVKLSPISLDMYYDGEVLKLSWKASPTAEKYRVFKRVAGTSDWGDSLTMTTGTTYIDTDIAANTTYEYAVQDWTLLDGAYCYSTLKLHTITTAQPKPPVLEITSNNSGYVLTISEVEDASGYKFYRSTDGVSFAEIANTTSTTYTDSSVTIGYTYHYRARAYFQSGSIVNYGAYSNVAYASDYAYVGTTNGILYESVAARAEETNFTFLKKQCDCGIVTVLPYAPGELPSGEYIYGVYGDHITLGVKVTADEQGYYIATLPHANADAIIFAENPIITYGDTNRDGELTLIDVVRTLKYAVGKTSVNMDIATGDMNGDIKITPLDVLELLKLVLN